MAARIGFFAGPLVAAAVYALVPLEPGGRATAAIGAWMAVWWMTEAIPLPATALLPAVAFPLTGALSAGAALRPYASGVVFLFMGGFMIGLAMQRWKLHLRIALTLVRLVGTTPRLLIGGFMLATAALSMWISNTATAIMLLPVGVSVIDLLRTHVNEADPAFVRFAAMLMLAIAYAASIGGLGTLIGSPPNLVFANFVGNELGRPVTMLTWMRVGVPLVLVMLPLAWLWLTRGMTLKVPAAARAEIDAELGRLAPMSRGERVVGVVFVLTALAWILRPQLNALPGLARLDDTLIALTAALALFVIPVDWRRRVFALDWDTAVKLPWGILLLFGGGLSLAAAIGANGVDAWLASGFAGLGGVAPIWVLLAVASLVIFVTELSSNTATANTFIPVLSAAAIGLGIEPMPVLMAAALAASCAFMLPVATPPNAIVFASGRVTIARMATTGFGLNLIAIAAIVAVTRVFV